MSILVDKNTRLLVQGITGNEGQFHTRQCIDYGTNVVAGVTPGKGGRKMDAVPVFNTVQAAQKVGIKVPVVIRMEGTNVEEGRKILSESGLNLITAVDLKDAAQKVAQLLE